MAEEKLIRGIHIIPLRDYIVEAFDDDMQRKIHAALSDDTKVMLATVERDDWHPVRMVAEMNRGIFEAHDDAEEGYDQVVKSGRAVAHYATNTFLRLLIKLMTPEIMAKKWPTVWKKSHNFGLMEANLESEDSRVLKLRLSDVDGYDYIGPTAVGFLTYSLKAMGLEAANAVERDRDLTQKTAPEYHFEITW